MGKRSTIQMPDLLLNWVPSCANTHTTNDTETTNNTATTTRNKYEYHILISMAIQVSSNCVNKALAADEPI